MLTPRTPPAAAGRPGHRRKAAVLIAVVSIGSGAVIGAHADDRPFLRTTHALASEDDDGWEVSAMAVVNRRGQALSTQIEHDLSPTQKLEFEFGHSPHALGPEPEQGVRLRSLWRSPAESGWGFATKIGLEPRRNGGGDDGGQRKQAQGVWSWAATPRSWLHLNLGWQWRRDDTSQRELRTTTQSLAVHTEWDGQRWLYAEAASSGDGRDRLLHMGVRHWLTPKRMALDTGVGQQNGYERPGRFLAINLSFFDLER